MSEKRINPLIKASGFYIIGNGIGQGIILLSTVIFTRVMSQDDYGNYSTYYSLVSILNTLVGANLFNGLNNAYIDYKNEIHKYRASNLFLSTLVFLIISIIALLGNWCLGNRLPAFMMSMALVHGYAFFVVNYYNNSANMENRYKMKTVFMMLPNILQVVISLMFIFLLPIGSLYSRIIGSTLGVLLCAGYCYLRMMRGQKKWINWEYWKYGLKISVPSVFSSISYMMMSQFDNVMITLMCGAEETAVYALIYNIGYILYAVMQATNGVLQAWLYRTLDAGNLEGVRNTQKWYLFIFAQMALGLYMVSPEIIKVLSPESYWKFEYITPFIIGSCMMVMYSFYSTLGLFYKKSASVSICVCASAMLNIVLNYIFISEFGGIAAAYTSAFSYFVLFLSLRRLGQRLKADLFSTKYFICFTFVVVLAGIVFTMIYNKIVIRYAIFLLLLIISLVYMYRKRNELLKIIGKGLTKK